MHHNVHAPLAELHQIGRAKGVVAHHGHAVRVRDLAQALNIRNHHVGVADGFEIEHAGFFVDGALHDREIVDIHQARGDAEALGQPVGKERVRAAVQRGGAHDFIPRFAQGERHGGLRRHARGEAHAGAAAFQRGQALFQHVRGGVGNARVDVAGALVVEDFARLLHAVEHKGSGLVNRRNARAGGVHALARVGLQGIKIGMFE